MWSESSHETNGRSSAFAPRKDLPTPAHVMCACASLSLAAPATVAALSSQERFTTSRCFTKFKKCHNLFSRCFSFKNDTPKSEKKEKLQFCPKNVPCKQHFFRCFRFRPWLLWLCWPLPWWLRTPCWRLCCPSPGQLLIASYKKGQFWRWKISMWHLFKQKPGIEKMFYYNNRFLRDCKTTSLLELRQQPNHPSQWLRLPGVDLWKIHNPKGRFRLLISTT